MAKTRVIVYMDPELLSEADRISVRVAVSRSAVLSAAIAAGLNEVDKTHVLKRHGQGARPVAPAGRGYIGRRRSPSTAQQRTVARLGQTLLRVNPSLPPDDLRDALIAEIPMHAPGVSPDSLDIDAIIDSLYDGHDGSLVPVPGDEPPEDPPD